MYNITISSYLFYLFQMYQDFIILDYPRVSLGSKNTIRVIEGSSVQLRCEVDAKPSVRSVRWSFNGKLVRSTSFLYNINNVNSEVEGEYTCSADNGLGRRAQATVTVKLLTPPKVHLPPRLESDVGSKLNVPCKTDVKLPDEQYVWTKVGSPSFKQTGRHLILNQVAIESHGEYICHVYIYVNTSDNINQRLEGNRTMSILVRHKPGRTSITASKQLIVGGDDLTLTCHGDPPGWPSPTYRWWKYPSNKTIAMGQNYSIQVVRLTSEGRYTCGASNTLGGGSIGVYNLEVHTAPRLITLLPPTLVKDEQQRGPTILCSAQAKPAPMVRWLHDGKPIVDRADEFTVDVQESKGKSNQTVVRTSLKFTTLLKAYHRGKYSCQFYNDIGDATSSLVLRIKRKLYTIH